MKKEYRNPDGSLKEPTRYISLGGGVQSTALVLMAVEGYFGTVPKAALFADLGWERNGFYQHLEKLTKAVAPFPIITLKPGNIREDILAEGMEWASMPLYTRNSKGVPAMLPRQCSYEYKIVPIRRYVRDELNDPSRKKRPGAVEMWLGISTDEALRMKDSTTNYIVHRYPLIEQGISRDDCNAYLKERGWEVARSACIGCPYTSGADWADMRANRPTDWADAVDFDNRVRNQKKGLPIYVHRSAKPLEQAVLNPDDERDHFDDECEGMCGV